MDRSAAAQEVGYRPTPWRQALQKESMELLRRFALVAAQHHLPYLILNGTLLGATKFEGVIPWDDDADVGIFLRDAPLLKQVLTQVVTDTP